MERFASRPAFHCRGDTLTFASLDKQSKALAAWLRQNMHISKGDRIAVMLPNVLAFPIATMGVMRSGAVQVNINPMYTARELAHQLNDSGAQVIVAWHAARATLGEVIGATRVSTVILVGADEDCESVGGVPTLSFSQALREGCHCRYLPVKLGGADTLFLQYTGGTSGVSKGAILSHRNLVANIEQFKAMYRTILRPGDERIVTAIPLYHIFALMLNFLTYCSMGAENWLVDNPRDLNTFVGVLKIASPTVFVGVNTLFATLLSHARIGEADFSALRLSIGGGAAVLSVVSARWQALTGTFIRQGYGLTETSPVVSFTPAAATGFSGSTGLPLPGTDVQLLGDDGRVAAAGQRGEICVRGPQVMRGYWQRADADSEAFTADGFFKTGDIGVIDVDGFLHIVDRKKDMVIVSGFNVYPNEVEAAASTLAGIAECACVGQPDPRTGEALVLFAVRAPGSSVSEDELIAHCRTLLTAYKVPRIIRMVERLPKSTVGKILRRELALPLSTPS